VCPTHATASSSCTIGTYLRAASRRDCDGLSRDRDHDLLDLTGTYGDPDAGDPIEYDELRIENDQGAVEIEVHTSSSVADWPVGASMLSRLRGAVAQEAEAKIQAELVRLLWKLRPGDGR